MKEGWNSHLWSEIDGNCIFADGLGAIWKIFSQTSHMRPEAKADRGGHMTNLSKWYQIKYRGHPKYLGQRFRKKVSSRGQRPETVKMWGNYKSYHHAIVTLWGNYYILGQNIHPWCSHHWSKFCFTINLVSCLPYQSYRRPYTLLTSPQYNI